MHAIKSGDIFCTSKSSNPISKIIMGIERLREQDGEADMSHSGVLRNELGDTYEMLWKGFASQNFFKEYKGHKVLIARCTSPEKEVSCFSALNRIEAKYKNCKYPYWRLGLYLFAPFFTRWNLFKAPVCSEMVGDYLSLLGARQKPYNGLTPEMLADELENYSIYKVIFKGEL